MTGAPHRLLTWMLPATPGTKWWVSGLVFALLVYKHDAQMAWAGRRQAQRACREPGMEPMVPHLCAQ